MLDLLSVAAACLWVAVGSWVWRREQEIYRTGEDEDP